MFAAEPAELHHQLGLTLFERGRFRESLESHRLAATIDPRHGEAHLRAGMLLWFQNDFDTALEHLQRAVALRPSDAMALSYQGLAAYGRGELRQAIAACDAAVALDPGSVDGHVHRGLVLHALDRTEEARQSYASALQLDPDCAHAHVFLAESLLAHGELARGWSEYEWRLRGTWWRATQVDAPRWDGSPLAGRTLLVHAEQGLGDTLQYVRFALQLIADGHDVVVEVQPPLVALLQNVPALRGRVLARGQVRPRFDVHAAMLSLPHLLQLRAISASTPYLDAIPRALPRDTFNVGLAWQGSRTHRLDRHRSIALRTLLPLADCGARLYSLQHGFGSEQLEPSMPIEAAPARFDFAAAAALVAGLDLVITIDSAVAHLAGALGVRTWLLLPHVADARWLRGRDDTPWYPTVRLFRQELPFAWDRVIDVVAARLREESSHMAMLNRSTTTGESAVAVASEERGEHS